MDRVRLSYFILAILILSLTSLAEGKNEIYHWQLDDYQRIKEGFKDIPEAHIEPEEVPNDVTERYFWQLDDYRRLRDGLNDIVEWHPPQDEVPRDNKKRYRWQVKDYKKLKEEFAPEIKDFTRDNPPPQEINE